MNVRIIRVQANENFVPKFCYRAKPNQQTFRWKVWSLQGGNTNASDAPMLVQVKKQASPKCHPFVWQNGLFVLGALGAPAWVSMLQAP